MNSPTRASTSGVSVTVIEPVPGDVTTEPDGDNIVLIVDCRPVYTDNCAFIVVLAVLSSEMPWLFIASEKLSSIALDRKSVV